MSKTKDNRITVLALNPAVDISYEVPQLIAEQKVRSAKTLYTPGGNGINVARGLRELDTPMHCCSIVGGESGKLLLRLLGESLGDDHRYFQVEGETRLNAILLQKNPPSQYEVDSVGPTVPAAVLKRLTRWFLEACGAGIAVLTGSTPPGVPDDIYRQLTEQIQGQGGRAIVDAHGPVLHEALAARPFMVRLNQYILEMTFKRRMDNLEEVAAAARELRQDNGIEFVCISLGAEGAILSMPNRSYYCSAPKVHVRSTVGAGDAMVAGMVSALQRGLPPADMLRLGVVCGSATAAHAGTCLFTREEARAPQPLELRELEVARA